MFCIKMYDNAMHIHSTSSFLHLSPVQLGIFFANSTLLENFWC